MDTPVPDLRRKTMDQCDTMLETDKFTKIDGSFNYLMNLPIASLTLKYAQKHEQDLANLKNDISAMESTTSRKMWFTELSCLKI
jgi:hypothetical protein